MKKEFNIYSIHYSCSGFYNGGAIAPTICCIALCNVKTNKLTSFSIETGLKQGLSLIHSEGRLLKEFIEFTSKINNPVFVHWNMIGLEYGFKSISARCENFGLEMFNMNEILDFNISEYSKYNFLDALDIIDSKKVTILTGKQEATCFDKKEYKLVRLSTEAKALGLVELFKNYTTTSWDNNGLKTKNTEKELNTATSIKLYKLLSDLKFSEYKITEIMEKLKTDTDKEFVINLIEKRKLMNNNLIEVLINEYLNKKHVKIYE